MPIIDDIVGSEILNKDVVLSLDGYFPSWRPFGYVYVSGEDNNQSSVIEFAGPTRSSGPYKVRLGPTGSPRAEFAARSGDTIKCRRGKVQVLIYAQ